MGVFFLFFCFGCIIMAASASQVRIASYNTGLTPKVAYFNDRQEEIVPALEELSADVLCLQEVWYSKDVSRIVEELKTTYPYSYSALHNKVSSLTQVSPIESPCMTSKFIFQFLPCLNMRCSSSAGEEHFLTCAERECELLGLEQHCISCLVMSESASPVQRCLFDLGNRFNVLGLLLLSKLPLEQATVTLFEPDQALILPRGYIAAQVSHIGKVACTHMAANLGPVYFENLPFNSWQDQNEAEARALLQMLHLDDHAVVMGDINSSPAISYLDIEEDMPGTFHLFTQAGFNASYTNGVGICTWCKYNPLAHARRNLVLDHIFTRNLEVISARRILDDVRVRGKYPLSDHYGIEVTVDVETTPP